MHTHASTQEHLIDLTVVAHGATDVEHVRTRIAYAVRRALADLPHDVELHDVGEPVATTCDTGACLIDAQRRDPSLQGFDRIAAWRRDRQPATPILNDWNGS